MERQGESVQLGRPSGFERRTLSIEPEARKPFLLQQSVKTPSVCPNQT